MNNNVSEEIVMLCDYFLWETKVSFFATLCDSQNLNKS